MSDLRILVAVALNASDLSASDLRETAIDRIGALAFADPLGARLWALKWANDASAFDRALGLLSQRSKRAARDVIMRRKLCRMAIEEWLYDLCLTCGGRGIRVATEFAPVRHCEACDGSGRRQPSELGRARALGLEVNAWRKWEPNYGLVQRKLVDAEERAWLDIARQLGRLDVDRFLSLNSLRRLQSTAHQ